MIQSSIFVWHIHTVLMIKIITDYLSHMILMQEAFKYIRIVLTLPVLEAIN